LLAKDPKTGEAVPWNPSPQQWIDGSVDNDLPMTRLAEMFNVNHFIVSQVNPHVVPFLIKEDDLITEDACQSTSALAAGPSWVHTMTHLAKGEALHRMHVMAEMGIFPNALTKAVSVLSQKYSGDITILPEISYTDFPRMLSNPTIEFMVKAMLSGERATWPKLSRVRNHCAIELALDEAVQKLRTRVVFSSSQADLRLGRPKSTRSEHVRVRRKLSNNSEIDASAIKGIRNGRIQNLKDTKHQKSQSLDIPLRLSNHHKKQKSETSTKAEKPKPWGPYETSVLSQWADNQALSPIASSPVGPLTIGNSLPLSKITYDLLSGPEKTSADSTSDSDNSFSSESLSSPPIPDLWPQSRTQPTTPAIERERRSNWSFSTLPVEEGEKTKGKSSLAAGSGELSMTPANESGPEKQYKRLFHSARNRLRRSEPQVIVSGDSESGTEKGSDTGKKEGLGRLKRWNAMGLAIDISGTRGMVLRKKRGDESR
jgi:TAG lipase/steryl ester hydrolase/phospholipase A2/LPA acyltransferase